jgi:hypothetical protein
MALVGGFKLGSNGIYMVNFVTVLGLVKSAKSAHVLAQLYVC